MVSGSLNVQSLEYAMIPPAVVFEMNGQSGDSSGDFGSLGGGSIGGSPEEENGEEMNTTTSSADT